MDTLSPSFHRRNTTDTTSLFDNFYVWLVTVLLCLVGIITLCVWLSLIPKNPTTTITDISVPTSNDNGNSSISYTVEFGNPNIDSSIYYDDVFLVFLLGDDSVGESKVGSFHQGTKKKYAVKGHVDVNSGIMAKLRDQILIAKMELKLRIRTKIRFKTWGVKSKVRGLNLQGQIPVGSDGKIKGKKKKVKLHHANSSNKCKRKGKYK